jgi:KaiC/GvpD/RAD55 family RecA-like ATPase
MRDYKFYHQRIFEGLQDRGTARPVELSRYRGIQRPRWPVGVEEIDAATGGFYGFSVIGGYPKLGKSMLAIRSSMLAAIEGWQVIYVNAENDGTVMLERAEAFMGCEQEFWDHRADRWDIIGVTPGTSLDQVTNEVKLAIPVQCDRLLIVLDSLTSIARYASMGDAKDSFFIHLNKLIRFCSSITRDTPEIGVLAISELNRKGGMTGQLIEYVAEMLISLTSGPTVGSVDMDVNSRITAGGDFETFRRAVQACRFVREGDQRPAHIYRDTGLRVVDH